MRKIEFRAWLKHEKKMIDVKAIDWDDVGNIISVNYPSGKAYSGYDGDNIELMQYTGLKDKNGVKIFEGDIFKWGSTLYQVIYADFGFKVNYVKGHNEIYLYDFQLNYFEENDEIEVIGNIYENKELLEII